MMSGDEFNRCCASLPATTHVIQWGGADVWKVGGKVFAIGGWSDRSYPFITFKCSQIAFEVLKEQPGLRPAPYLASRGGKWIQMHDLPGLARPDLKEHLALSHALIVEKLTRKIRAELDLTPQ